MAGSEVPQQSAGDAGGDLERTKSSSRMTTGRPLATAVAAIFDPPQDVSSVVTQFPCCDFRQARNVAPM